GLGRSSNVSVRCSPNIPVSNRALSLACDHPLPCSIRQCRGVNEVNQMRMVDVQEVLAQAGDALSKASGEMLKLGDAEVLSEDSRRNFIARAVAHNADGRSRSVIVKATRSSAYDPAAANVVEVSGLAKEWVACAFLASRAPSRGHGAALLAGDVSKGIMVFEDLGAHLRSLVDPLLKGTP